MKCFFCKAHVNEKRQTTVYALVPRKNGSMKKVRWCKPCDGNKADQIDQFLREHDDVSTGAENGPENWSR